MYLELQSDLSLTSYDRRSLDVPEGLYQVFNPTYIVTKPEVWYVHTYMGRDFMAETMSLHTSVYVEEWGRRKPKLYYYCNISNIWVAFARNCANINIPKIIDGKYNI